jgi:hypothetical protein
MRVGVRLTLCVVFVLTFVAASACLVAWCRQSSYWDVGFVAKKSLRVVKEFYDFLMIKKEGMGEEEFGDRMPRVFDTRMESKTFETWFHLHMLKNVFLSEQKSSSKSRFSDSPLRSWELLIGFAPDRYPLNSAWMPEAYVILQSPLEVGQRGESLLGYKQVCFRTVHHPGARPLISRESISVNGIILFDDIWSEYWIEKFSYLSVDLWIRFGISVSWEFPVRPFPAEEFRVIAGTKDSICKNGMSKVEGSADKGAMQWLSEVMKSLVSFYSCGCCTRREQAKELEIVLSCAKGAISIFYEDLLNDRPPKECRNIFVAGSGGSMLKESEAEETWAWLKEHRWLFVDPTLLTNRWRSASEAMLEFVEFPSLVVFKMPLRLYRWALGEFFVIYELDPPEPVGEPLWLNCDPKTVRQVWFPIVQTGEGCRIVVNSMLVNGLLVSGLRSGRVPPSLELWKALGFPLSPDEVSSR